LQSAHDWSDAGWLAVKTNKEALDQWSKFYEEEKDAAGRAKYPFVGFVKQEDKKT
jgi:hypothetical protein